MGPFEKNIQNTALVLAKISPFWILENGLQDRERADSKSVGRLCAFRRNQMFADLSETSVDKVRFIVNLHINTIQ